MGVFTVVTCDCAIFRLLAWGGPSVASSSMATPGVTVEVLGVGEGNGGGGDEVGVMIITQYF